MIPELGGFRRVVRVSGDKFAELLAGSPALAERPASDYYAACLRAGIDPLFILAMFRHESEHGRKGIATATKSWGNTGFPTFGPAPVGQLAHPATGKAFPSFASWLDGLEATLARLNAPTWVYAVRATIRDIFIHPSGDVWAPSRDRNDPAGYLRAVLAYMNRHADQEVHTAGNPLAKLTDRVQLMPDTNRNWGKRLMWGGSPSGITVHETGNLAPGANAAMHADFVENGGGEHEVSFHAVVDERESIQLMPWDWVAWHGGDGQNGQCNNDRIAIETVQIGNFQKTIDKLVVLVANLMEEFAIPISEVDQHHDCSGKNCPQFLRSGGKGVTWAQFLAKLAAELVRRRAQPVAADPLRIIVKTYIDANGEPHLDINFRGKARRIVGVNIQDLGISLEGENGLLHDRSIIGNEERPYVVRK